VVCESASLAHWCSGPSTRRQLAWCKLCLFVCLLLNPRTTEGGVGYHPPVFSKRHIFSEQIFRNASVYLWATHFHIFWWINFKKMLLPGKTVLKKVKCLGGLPPPRSQLLYKIGTKFQRLPHVFGDKVSNGTIGNTVWRNRKSEIQDGGLQSGYVYLDL